MWGHLQRILHRKGLRNFNERMPILLQQQRQEGFRMWFPRVQKWCFFARKLPHLVCDIFPIIGTLRQHLYSEQKCQVSKLKMGSCWLSEIILWLESFTTFCIKIKERNKNYEKVDTSINSYQIGDFWQYWTFLLMRTYQAHLDRLNTIKDLKDDSDSHIKFLHI